MRWKPLQAPSFAADSSDLWQERAPTSADENPKRAGSSHRRVHWEPGSQESKDRVRENIVAVPGDHVARVRDVHVLRGRREP
jgi:hypothetical protein